MVLNLQSMFFKKKNPIPPENVAKQSIKKMDHVVTGLLLGGIIASIYGVKKLREKDHHESQSHHEEEIHTEEPRHEMTERKEQKQSILSRIFFGNK